MKINDIIQLTEQTLDQRINRATKTWIDEWNKEVLQNTTLANNPGSLQQYGALLARDNQGKTLFTPDVPTSMDPESVNSYIRNIISTVFSTGKLRQSFAASAPTEKSPFVKIDDNPLTIAYGRQTFVLGADNQWRYFGDTKQRVVDPTTSALLNKQRAKYQPEYSMASDKPPAGARDVRSSKNLDTSREIFVPGHGVVRKDDDGTWYSLVTGKELNDVDIPYAEKKLAQANARDPKVFGINPARIGAQ